MRLLVTGATGFIGSHICEGLLDNGDEVYGLSRLRDTSKISEFVGHPRFHTVKGDITDFDVLHRLFHETKFEAIFHVAVHHPHQYTDDPFPCFEANVRGTINIMRAAYLAGINRVVASSSMSVYGPAEYLPVNEKHPTKPANLYGLSKLMDDMVYEHYAQRFGVKTIVLRYSGVFGPRRGWGAVSNFTTKALASEPPVILSDGSDQWDNLHVKDVVKANTLALDNIDKLQFEILNIGLGRGVSVAYVATKIIELTNAAVELQFGNASPAPPFIYDISKATRLLGFVPRPFEEALEEYVEWEKGRKR